ncbi:MAG: hypothetical protein ACKO37_03315 [Vampirovibrionales bacterium]
MTIIDEEEQSLEQNLQEEDIESSEDNSETESEKTESEETKVSDAEEEEFIVSLGDEPEAEEPAPTSHLLRDLRKTIREKTKRIKELESQTSRPVQKTTLGPKPKLEDTDFDTDEFEKRLETWYAQKSVVDAEERDLQKQEEEQKRQWQSKLDEYEKSKSTLRVRDYEDAEATVQELFSVTQQGMILEGALNPAVLVYVLGKNPEKATKFAKITNPIAFAFEMGRLEKDIKMTKKTTTPSSVPAPERSVQGTAKLRTDNHLDRLRKEAETSGDFTKVVAYKKQQANKK